MTLTRRERVQRFLQSASTLCNPGYSEFDEVRAELTHTTGLSRQNVDWAFDCAFEVHPSMWDLEALCRRTPECERAHVLLSANVFVGALRAIAIAIAAAPEVHVRPSRREPQMVQWLAQVAPGDFEIENELRPMPGDHVWAYGSDPTMRELRKELPAGTTIHEHGHGYGIVVLFESDLRFAPSLGTIAEAIAADTAPFDQRGCLSPRIVLIEAGHSSAQEFSIALAAALAERERVIPFGFLSEDERADIVRYRDALIVAGAVLRAGSGFVTFESEKLPWLLPPAGRILHVKAAANAILEARAKSPELTTIGVFRPESENTLSLSRAFPSARIAAIGSMQRPMLDGPVDLRCSTSVPSLQFGT